MLLCIWLKNKWFYVLVTDTAAMSSRDLDMVMLVIIAIDQTHAYTIPIARFYHHHA